MAPGLANLPIHLRDTDKKGKSEGRVRHTNENKWVCGAMSLQEVMFEVWCTLVFFPLTLKRMIGYKMNQCYLVRS